MEDLEDELDLQSQVSVDSRDGLSIEPFFSKFYDDADEALEGSEMGNGGETEENGSSLHPSLGHRKSNDTSWKSSFKKTRQLQIGVLEGTTFLNNYIVVDTLGRGSYGKVKLCLNVADDCLYAVKVIDKRMVGHTYNLNSIAFELVNALRAFIC